MFQPTENIKQSQAEHHAFHPFTPINTNSGLRGHTKTIGKYQFSFDQKLGSGLTSDAYIGINKETKKLVCVKIIDRETFKKESQKALLQNEIRCLKKLKSEYIVNVYDVYDTNSFCFVVTQLCEDGDLFKLIQYSRYGLPQHLVVRLAQNLVQALLKMKQCKIIHRDIKSQNILLSNGKAKLGDFGFAIQEKDLKQRQDFSYGSPLYMPLQSLEKNHYSFKSDIFSLGVVLYEMLHGQSPWQCNEQKQLINKIKIEPVTYKSGISEGMKSIISSCLQNDIQKRACIQKVAQQVRKLCRQMALNSQIGRKQSLEKSQQQLNVQN